MGHLLVTSPAISAVALVNSGWLRQPVEYSVSTDGPSIGLFAPADRAAASGLLTDWGAPPLADGAHPLFARCDVRDDEWTALTLYFAPDGASARPNVPLFGTSSRWGDRQGEADRCRYFHLAACAGTEADQLVDGVAASLTGSSPEVLAVAREVWRSVQGTCWPQLVAFDDLRRRMKLQAALPARSVPRELNTFGDVRSLASSFRSAGLVAAYVGVTISAEGTSVRLYSTPATTSVVAMCRRLERVRHGRA